jgi:hypothetical protein
MRILSGFGRGPRRDLQEIAMYNPNPFNASDAS